MVQRKGRRREPTREELDARGREIVQKGVILYLGWGTVHGVIVPKT